MKKVIWSINWTRWLPSMVLIIAMHIVLLETSLQTLGIAKIISKKAPNVWKASLLTMDKTKSLDLIKKELFFCTNEYFYGKSRPYVQTFVCQHPEISLAFVF